MGNQHTLRLTRHDGANIGRQVFLECVFVSLFRGVLAPFDLGQDAFVAAAQFLLELKPFAVKRAADAALAVGIVLSELLHLRFQFTGELPSLELLLVEPAADFRILDVFRGIAVAVLPVAAGFNEMFQRADGVVLVGHWHGLPVETSEMANRQQPLSLSIRNQVNKKPPEFR